MPEAAFRFDQELNDFLTKFRQKADFQAGFEGKRSVKEVIDQMIS
jgi:hypothetical protein